jgi:hypothetical protein
MTTAPGCKSQWYFRKAMLDSVVVLENMLLRAEAYPSLHCIAEADNIIEPTIMYGFDHGSKTKWNLYERECLRRVSDLFTTIPFHNIPSSFRDAHISPVHFNWTRPQWRKLARPDVPVPPLIKSEILKDRERLQNPKWEDAPAQNLGLALRASLNQFEMLLRYLTGPKGESYEDTQDFESSLVGIHTYVNQLEQKFNDSIDTGKDPHAVSSKFKHYTLSDFEEAKSYRRKNGLTRGFFFVQQYIALEARIVYLGRNTR